MNIIVIEGIDCSGKETVSKMLTKRIGEELTGDVMQIEFPNYESNIGKCVRSYLDNQYVDYKERLPMLFSSIYSLDRSLFFRTRMESGKSREQEMNEKYRFVIADRYTSSNYIHMGARLVNSTVGEYETSQILREYVYKLEDMEHNLYLVPRPRHTFILNPKLDTIIERIKKRNSNKHGASVDIHENDNTHLRNAYATIQYFKDFNILRNTTYVECGDLSPEEITNEIFRMITLGV